MGSLLTKNATVVTMDRALGDITDWDILIVAGRIVDVACGMHAPETVAVDATGTEHLGNRKPNFS